MKKIFKIAIVAAIVCLILGGVMLIMGALQGGLSEANRYLYNNTGFHGVAILSNDRHEDVVNDSDWKEEGQNMDLEEGKTYDLDLEIQRGMVTIVQSEDSEFFVGGEDGSKLQCYMEGNTIHVNRRGGYHAIRRDMDVVLYLPANVQWRNIDLEVGGGTLEADILKAHEISVDVGAGRADMEVVEADKGDFTVDAGEMIINKGNFRTLEMNIGMGNFEMKGVVEKDLQAEVGMGNIYMELADREDNHNFSLEYGIGTISVGRNSYSGIGEKNIYNHNADSSYEIECGMGNVEINFIEF